MYAVMAIASRDLLKFLRDPGRLVAAVVFPFVMIFLLGGTLQMNLGRAVGFSFIAFTFTGFLGMTLFQSTAQGLTSLMDDRQNDFAQELFVSPVSRYSIVFGKVLGETTVAIVQVIPMVLFAVALRVPLSPTHLALLGPVAILSCFMGGAFGLLLLNTMSDTRGFEPDLQLRVSSAVLSCGPDQPDQRSALVPGCVVPDFSDALRH